MSSDTKPPDRRPGFIFRTSDYRDGSDAYELRFPTNDGQTLTIRMGPATLEWLRGRVAQEKTPSPSV